MRFLAIVVVLGIGVFAAARESRWLRDVDMDHQTHLQHVITNGNLAELRRLVQEGADLETRDIDGTTPLLCAALFGRTREALMLIEAGASVDVTDHRGWTACMMAAAGGHVEVMQSLIQAGANLNATSFDGRSAVMFARDNEHPELVAMLIRAGARPDPRGGTNPAASIGSASPAESGVKSTRVAAGLGLAQVASESSSGQSFRSDSWRRRHRAFRASSMLSQMHN